MSPWLTFYQLRDYEVMLADYRARNSPLTNGTRTDTVQREVDTKLPHRLSRMR